MIKNSSIYLLLYLVPKNFVSMLMGKLVSIRWPKSFMTFINQKFVRAFNIDLTEAEKPLSEYESLQELFIRKLKPGLRPISSEGILSPCDGNMSIQGQIKEGLLIQAKGKLYELKDLLPSRLADNFIDGHYATIYLSPKDYHRFHMPVDGFIEKTIYVPGHLWPVNNWAVKNVAKLFCQNERVISLIKPKDQQGLIAQIAVGATMVGKIDMDYCSIPAYKQSKDVITLDHDSSIYLNKGDELGKFMFGSTIILLFSPGLINSFAKSAPSALRVNEPLANF